MKPGAGDIIHVKANESYCVNVEMETNQCYGFGSSSSSEHEYDDTLQKDATEKQPQGRSAFDMKPGTGEAASGCLPDIVHVKPNESYCANVELEANRCYGFGFTSPFVLNSLHEYDDTLLGSEDSTVTTRKKHEYEYIEDN